MRTFKIFFPWIRNLFSLENIIFLSLWLLKWIMIFFAMGVFVLCSMMIGKSIKDNAWILLASDLIFCWLFWMFLGLSKYVSYGSSLSRKYLPRAIILGISMIIMFILIAMATLGVSISNSMVLFNIWVFPIMVFITLGLSLNYRSKRFA